MLPCIHFDAWRSEVRKADGRRSANFHVLEFGHYWKLHQGGIRGTKTIHHHHLGRLRWLLGKYFNLRFLCLVLPVFTVSGWTNCGGREQKKIDIKLTSPYAPIPMFHWFSHKSRDQASKQSKLLLWSPRTCFDKSVTFATKEFFADIFMISWGLKLIFRQFSALNEGKKDPTKYVWY